MTDCLHEPCAEPIWWSVVNAAEAFPGVLTPLTWSWTGPALERYTRDAFYAIGCLRATDRAVPENVSRRVARLTYGRVTINVNTMHQVTNRMPGAKAEDFESRFLADEHFEFPAERSFNYYPMAAAKLPRAAIRSQALWQLGRETETWWRHAVSNRPINREAALHRLAAASERLVRVGSRHAVATMTMFLLHTMVERLLARVDMSDLSGVLLTTEGTEEHRSVVDLWAVSREELPLDQFLARHGFHGPAHELSGYAWREDQRAVDALIKTYQDLPEDASPAVLADRRLSEREAAERRFLTALSGPQRRAAEFLLRHGRQYTALRQLGRNTILRTVDVARQAARTIGTELAPDTLDQPEDVSYLTAAELAELPADARQLVEFRRERRTLYQQFQLPDRWFGEVHTTTANAPESRNTLTGIGVSNGIVKARARVVVDPYEEFIEPGEILVCETTDPSWASLFFVAAGVVINVGGQLSHGAVVARELGIPCVVNVRGATCVIQTGDVLKIDGSAGIVEIV
jgi:phosphohistidine swiveling domain-containing protein